MWPLAPRRRDTVGTTVAAVVGGVPGRAVNMAVPLVVAATAGLVGDRLREVRRLLNVPVQVVVKGGVQSADAVVGRIVIMLPRTCFGE